MSSLSLRPKADATDIVFIDSVELSANIGPDWWGRPRAQPVTVSVYLHLRQSYLDRAGETDNVRDSVHYGNLCKSITKLAEDPEARFNGPRGLARAVILVALQLAGEAATQACVVVTSSKLVPLASEFVLEMTTPAPSAQNQECLETVEVFVKQLVIPTIIGVNPPEREAKQRVITNIHVLEHSGHPNSTDYSQLVAKISKDIESSSYLTLEKFVLEIIQTACLSSEAIDAVTVRAEKPSALSFAHAAGVQITRTRSSFLS
ncbi:hypothetical protein AcW1_002120 [Taiwanofungus camphoratus]|nr:hypothetical protein AcW1_002120 [Antrodia cinnamomea]